MSELNSHPDHQRRWWARFSRPEAIWNRLGWNLTLTFILAAVLPIVVVTFVLLPRIRAQALEQIASQMQTVGELKEQEIAGWLDERRDNLDLLLADRVQAQLLAEVATAPPDGLSMEVPFTSDQQRANEFLRNAVQASGQFYEFFVYNTTGQVIAASDPDQIGKILNRRPYFEASLQDTFIQSPYYEVGIDGITMMMGVPLRAASGQVVGVLAGRPDMSILGRIMAERAGLGETGETYLVSSESHYMVTPSRWLDQGYPLTQAYFSDGIDRALQGHTGSGTYEDYRQVPVVGNYRWLPALHVALLAEVDQEEALAPFSATQNMIWGLLLVAFSLAVVAGIYMTSRIVRPVTHLTQIADRLASGDLDQRATMPQFYELGILAAAFNTMSGRLKTLITDLEQRLIELQQAQAMLTYYSEYQSLIASLSTGFINLPVEHIDEAIDEALAHIGEFVSADRSYIYRYSEPDNTLTMTHEWCAPDTKSLIHERQNLPVDDTAWLMEKIMQIEPLHVAGFDDLPPRAESFKAVMRELEVNEWITVPLAYQGKLYGLAGFDSTRVGKNWSEDTMALLKLAGEVFINALQRQSSDEALRASEAKYRTLIEQASDGIFLADSNGRYIEVNPSGCELLGYSRDELLALSIQDLIPKSDLQAAPLQFDAILAGKTVRSERHLRRKDGSLVMVELNGKMLSDGRLQAFAHDITERKQAEQALQQERDRAQQYLDITRTMMIVVNQDETIGLVNRMGGEILGHPPDELIGKNWFDTFLPPSIKEEIHRDFHRLMAGETIDMSTYYENSIVNAGGEERMIAWHNTLLRDEAGNPIGTLSSGVDISERKRAEEALRQSEQRLRDAQRIARMGNWRWDIRTDDLFWSDEIYRIFGDDPGTFQPTYPAFLERVYPDDRPLVESAVADALNGTPYRIEHRIVLLNHTVRYVLEQGEVVYDEAENPLMMNGVMRDITERKLAEEALRQSEQRLRDAQRIARMGNWQWNIRADQSTWSDEIYRIFGHEPGTFDPTYADFLAQVHPDDRPLVESAVADALNGEPYRIEYRIVLPNQAVRQVLEQGEVVYDEAENPLMMNGIVLDITERKQAEKALRESQQLLEKIFSSLNEAIFIIDSKTRTIIDGNAAVETIFGYSKEEVVGRTTEFLHVNHEMYASFGKMAPDERKLMGGFQAEYQMRRKDGSIFESEHVVTHIVDSVDSTIVVSVIRDISERKQAEKALRDERNLMRAIMDAVPEQIYVKDLEHRFVLANRATGQRWGDEKLVGKSDLDILSPERAALRRQEEDIIFATGQPIADREDAIESDGGETIWMLINKIPLYDADGAIVGLVGVTHNITERKHTEKALRDERNLLRAIIDAVPEQIYVKDLEHRLVLVNRATSQYWGDQDLVGKSDLDISSPEHATLRHREEDIIFATGQPVVDREDAIKKDGGETIWMLNNKVPLYDADGALIGLVGVTRNITERKQAERALREERNLLRSIIDTVPEQIYVKDLEHRFVLVNRATRQYWGDEDLVGKSDLDLSSPEHAALRHREDDILYATGQPVVDREDAIEKDSGETIWVLNNKVPLYDTDGVIVGLVGANHNITGRKQAELALRHSEQTAREFQEKLKSLHDISIALTAVDDLDDVYHHAVEWGCSRLGFDRMGILLLGENDTVAGVGVDSEGRVRKTQPVPAGSTDGWPMIAQAIENDLHVSYKEHGMLYDDTGAVGEGWHAVTPLWQDDQYIGLVSVDNLRHQQPIKSYQLELLSLYGSLLSNLIMIKRTGEILRQFNEQLEQRVAERTSELQAANQELESFAYSVSHDLRAPLRSINGFSQVLLDDYHRVLDEEGQDYLRRVRASAQRMGSLIDDLLHLSRVTRRELQRQQVDLSAMAAEIAANLGGSEPERQVEFDIETGLEAEGDSGLLKVVLDNLIGNAWKFTSKQDQARIEFGVEQQDGQRVFYVRDDGAGFDMTYADKLFGAFQRLHGVEEFEGTGIGLATVRRIIQRHGGRIWAEGAVDQGATFYFTLR